MRVDGYEMNPQEIKQGILRLVSSHSSGVDADVFLRKHYESEGVESTWFNAFGVTSDADTLLSILQDAEQHGMSAKRFPISQIKKDLASYKALNFDKDNINTVVSRLEYNLSKAYLLYTAGHRFGFANPYRSINTLDKSKDEVKRILAGQNFGLELEYPDSLFFNRALTVVRSHSGMKAFIDSCMPSSKFYYDMQANYINRSAADTTSRAKYAANMERQRWHIKDAPENHQKYVLVNIPSYELWGVCPDSILNMKVVCGATATQSPVLNSRIKKIDLNPQWYVPMSIIKKGLAHAGPGYFSRHNMYFVTSSGQVKSYASPAERMSGRVAIVQRGGSSNSLGRIIFRFDNRFSVYLHHTNAPWAFQGTKRALSHGCIRLQRPIDLARFVLSDNKANMIDKIQYSFECDLSQIDSTRFIKKVDLQPEIPVYILYQTLFQVPGTHELREYQDVYGLDRKLYDKLMMVVSPSDSTKTQDKEKGKDKKASSTPSASIRQQGDSNRVNMSATEQSSNHATDSRDRNP